MKDEFDKTRLFLECQKRAIGVIDEYRIEEFDGYYYKFLGSISRSSLEESINQMQASGKNLIVRALVNNWDLGPEYIGKNEIALKAIERIQYNLELQLAKCIFKRELQKSLLVP